MKFTDGYWKMRQGVTPHFPMHAHSVTTEENASPFLPQRKGSSIAGMR